MIKSNQTCLISVVLGERERVSSGSGEALVGSTQTGAVQESGHGRGTPRGGTGRSNRGTFSFFCFDFFSSSYPINLFSPPPSNSLRLSCHFYHYLYEHLYKYISCFSFLIPVTVITVFFFFFLYMPTTFVSDSQDTVITVINTYTHTHTHTCIWYTLTLTHASVSSPVTVNPTHPHSLNQVMHSKSSTQPPCWSPVSTTALNLILWHH